MRKRRIEKVIKQIVKEKGIICNDVDYHKTIEMNYLKKGVEVTLYTPETTKIPGRYEVADLYNKFVYKKGEKFLRELNQKEIAKESYKLYNPNSKEIEDFIRDKCDYPIEWEFENGLVKYTYKKVANWCGDGFRSGDCVRSAVTDEVGYDQEGYYNEEIEERLNSIIKNNRERFFTPSNIKMKIQKTFVTWKEVKNEIMRIRNYAIDSNKETFERQKEYFKNLTNHVYLYSEWYINNLEQAIKDKSKILLHGSEWFLSKKWEEKFEKEKIENFKKIVEGYKEIEMPTVEYNFKALIPNNAKSITLKVPEDYMGLVIGKGGKNIKEIQKKLNIKIKLIKD